MEQIKSLKSKNNQFFRQLFFILSLIFIGIVVWQQLSFFISSFLGAITLYVVLRSSLFYLTEKKHWKAWQASLLLVCATTLVLLGIGFLIFEVVASELSTVDLSGSMDTIESYMDKLSVYLQHPIVPKDVVMQSQDVLTGLLSGFLNTAYNFIFNLFMMVIVLYFMFANGKKMERVIVEYSPFSGESLSMIKKEVKGMIYSNAVGLPLIMLVQGVAAGLGYWVVGIQDVIFWAFLTAIFGLLPVVGTAAIWAPLSITLIVNGNIWQGIVLLLYGAFIVTNVDNACRLVLMKKMANTHPLVVIFGVILGIPLFGFWGIIFGPLLISGFLLLLKIYHTEYKKEDKCECVQENDHEELIEE